MTRKFRSLHEHLRWQTLSEEQKRAERNAERRERYAQKKADRERSGEGWAQVISFPAHRKKKGKT